MRLNLEALLVLEAINRNGSFAKAAKELHRVRSALTYTVNKLEEDLGVILFDRSSHKPQLTPIGMFLLREGKSLLQSAIDIEKAIKRFDSGWEEEINIAIDETISIEKIYPLLEKFFTDCPYTQLNISYEILGGCWDALMTGRSDIVIGVSGDPPLEGGFGIKKLGRMKFVFAIAPFHPLANKLEPLKNSEILSYRAIVVPDTSKRLLARSSGTISGQKIFRVPTIQAKISAHMAGLGVGYLPLHLIKNEIEMGKLIIMQVEKPKPDGIFSLAWNLKRVGKATKWLVNNLILSF